MTSNELFSIFALLITAIGCFLGALVFLSAMTNRRIQLVESYNIQIEKEEHERKMLESAEGDPDMEAINEDEFVHMKMS